MALKQIGIHRTEAEFEIIDAAIKEKGREFTSYVRSEIFKLQKREKLITHIPPEKEPKKRRQVYVSEPTYEILKRLSAKTKKPINTLVNEFIIAPLLAP